MREIAEFRINERFASRLFDDKEGKLLGDGTSVRRINISTDDIRYQRIGALQAELQLSYGEPFFYGWSLSRKYSRNEIESAAALTVHTNAVFEPAGEETGTLYDESTACRHCGSGARQIGPLVLNVRRIPKGRDFAQTIADELVVSRRTVECFEKHGVTGSEFGIIQPKGSSASSPEEWFQWTARSTSAEIIAPTKVGVNPFDHDSSGQYRCPCGDLIGLNMLSEVFVKDGDWRNTDVVASRQFIGVRRGLLRPRRLLMVSPKVWQVVNHEKLKGFQFEVVHVL